MSTLSSLIYQIRQNINDYLLSTTALTIHSRYLFLLGRIFLLQVPLCDEVTGGVRPFCNLTLIIILFEVEQRKWNNGDWWWIYHSIDCKPVMQFIYIRYQPGTLYVSLRYIINTIGQVQTERRLTFRYIRNRCNVGRVPDYHIYWRPYFATLYISQKKDSNRNTHLVLKSWVKFSKIFEWHERTNTIL